MIKCLFCGDEYTEAFQCAQCNLFGCSDCIEDTIYGLACEECAEILSNRNDGDDWENE